MLEELQDICQWTVSSSSFIDETRANLKWGGTDTAAYSLHLGSIGLYPLLR